MSDTYEHEKPYILTGEYIDGSEPSPLSTPCDLHAVYDETIGGLNRAINATGFSALSFGSLEAKLYTRYLVPSGVSSNAFGIPNVRNNNKYNFPVGFNASNFGQPTIQNLKRYLNPIGLNATVFGQAQVKSLRTYLTDSGRNFQAFGDARISFKVQKANVLGINATVFGNQMVAYAVRTVEMSSTNGDMSRFGTQWLEYNPRYISPRGIFEQLPSNHLVSPTRFIRPEGFDAAGFGTRIIPENQKIYTQGIAGSFGNASVLNRRQYIKPKGFLTVGEFPEYRWGRADVWNKTQYIHADGVKPPNLNLPDIERTKIFNLNRIITTFGTLHQRFGYQQIDNNARVLHPVGIASPIEVNPTKTMVAEGIRHFAMSGIAAPVLGTWHNVRLVARLIQPQGFTASMFGTPHVENTRRNFRFIGMGEQSLFGQAMVSDAVRVLSFEHRYTIAPPQIPLPMVKLGTRYIEPTGVDSMRLGWHEIVTRFNKLYPRWEVKNTVGEPIVRNVTPELKGRGQDLSEFGTPRIDLYTRYIHPDGLNAAIFGQTKISDSKQFVRAIGIAAPVITRFHEVIRLGGQYIPHMIDLSGQGIETENFSQAPNLHRVAQNVIRPESKQPMTLFGSTVVTANTIRVEPGYWEILIGEPIITHKNRRLTVGAFEDVFEPSKPAVSPHTIYAGIVNPPYQAVLNHPYTGPPLHPIDGLYRQPGAIFGTARVEHFHRRIGAMGDDLSRFGSSAVRQANFYIRPKGWNSLRVGMIAPIGDQTISFRKSMDFSAFGTASLRHVEPLHRVIKPQGIGSLGLGNHKAQLFQRNIYPVGLHALRMGTKKYNDQPYLWQGLRIGEHIPTCIGGGDLSEFGTAWISLRVREINPMGLDYALVNEYDYTEFDKRMRVVRREQDISVQQIKPVGFNASMFNASDIKNKVHYIRPDGNAEQFRKGAF